MKKHLPLSALTTAVLCAMSITAHAQDSDNDADNQTIEEITVVGKSVSYANNAVSQDMVNQ